jgi:glycosyltransferase involved in cell wall biosynthesis
VSTPTIVICAKSPWTPTIRREHALAIEAARAGCSVTFHERPRDVRRLTGGAPTVDAPPGIVVRPRRTVVPGHRGRLAHAMDAASLRRGLPSHIDGAAPSAVVVNTPWNWAGTSRMASGSRRIFDLADDWRLLLPHARAAIERQYARIGEQADAIIVAAPALAPLFSRDVIVVPNGTSNQLLAPVSTPPPGRRRLVYVGTLSERFDVALVTEVMHRLPAWSLHLYGPCHYAGHRDRPDPQLRRLLSRAGSQVTWHGPASRGLVPILLDAGDVLILPNDPDIARGQDSMKLYDYAARARPIVSTPLGIAGDLPPGLIEADGPAEFSAAIVRAARAPMAAGPSRDWARRHTWGQRIGPWLDAVLGSDASVAS